MPENNFEKEVQQLFDGLKLKPSAEVWTKVQSHLQKDKRRRRFIFWIPSLLLLLGAGGYWMAKQENTHPVSTVTHPGNPVTKNFPEQQKEEEHITAFNKDKSNDNEEADHLPATSHRAGESLPAGKPASDDPAPHHLKPVIKTSRQQQHVALSKENDLSGAEEEEDITQSAGMPGNNDILAAQEAAPLTGYPQRVSYPLSFAGRVNGEQYIDHISPASQTPVKLSKKKRWEWGIEAGAGGSRIGKGISDILKRESDIDKPSSDIVVAPPNYGNGGITLNNVAGQNNTYIAALAPFASPVKPGPSWRAGFFVKVQVKERLALSSGIMYNYFSTQREVGKSISSSQGFSQSITNARYAATYAQQEGKNYTNKYHYITLPLGIQWQLNKGIKLPLALDAGVDLSWMAATNALHYDANTGAYFEDKSLFNKFQAGIYTGLSVKLFQHGRHPLDIGPVLQYNFSNLLKPGDYNNQNMIYGGISARLVLWKQ